MTTATMTETTSTATIWVDERGFARVTVLPGAEQNLAEAQETTRIMVEQTGGRPRPLLVDLRLMKALGREARQHYGSPEVTRHSTAIALLGSSRVSMLIANFFIAVTNPVVPTKLFTDEAEAIAWLKGF